MIIKIFNLINKVKTGCGLVLCTHATPLKSKGTVLTQISRIYVDLIVMWAAQSMIPLESPSEDSQCHIGAYTSSVFSQVNLLSL